MVSVFGPLYHKRKHSTCIVYFLVENTIEQVRLDWALQILIVTLTSLRESRDVRLQTPILAGTIGNYIRPKN